MSQENVELAHRAYDAFQRGDLDGFLACVDPEVEWYPLAHEVDGVAHGHEGVRQWWTNLLAVFPDWKPSMVELRDLSGRFVVIHARGMGSGAGSGVGIDMDLWQAVEVRHGRIVWYRVLRTERDALEAVGLRE